MIYNGIFGSARVRTMTRSLRDHRGGKAPFSEEKTYTWYPSFYRAALEVSYHMNGGRVSRSLRHYPIIPLTSSVFELCRKGDLEGFKAALARNEVPIFAQNHRGDTLLHAAASGANLDLVALLITLGVDANHDDCFGFTALVFYCWRKTCVETGVRLLVTSQNELTESHLYKSLDEYRGTPKGLELILSPELCPTNFEWPSLLHGVVSCFSRNFVRWTPLTEKLVRQATDLHCVGGTCATLLDTLIVHGQDPIEDSLLIQAWLDVLVKQGRDVRQYLEEEQELHEESEKLTLRHFPTGMQRKLLFDLGDEPNVTSDWWYDSKTEGFLLCNEFRHMICHYELKLYRFGWHSAWPFGIPGRSFYSDEGDLPKPSDSGELMLNDDGFVIYVDDDECQQLLDLANIRAARRFAKRRAKLSGEKKRHRSKRMPGTWPDA